MEADIAYLIATGVVILVVEGLFQYGRSRPQALMVVGERPAGAGTELGPPRPA